MTRLQRVVIVFNDSEVSQSLLAKAVSEATSSSTLSVEPVKFSKLKQWSLREWVGVQRADVVHWLSPYPWTKLGYPDFQGLSIVSIHHLDEGEDWPCHKSLPRWLVTHSRSSSLSIEATCRRVPDRVLPYGFEGSRFQVCDQEMRLDSRKELGIEEQAFVIGWFGNARQSYKNLDLLVEGVCIAKETVELQVLLVGQSLEAIQRELTSRGIRTTVVPSAGSNEIRNLYASLDVYVCTSRVEGGPLPVLEALACGIPVVSTDVGHVKDLIQRNSSNGFVVGTDARLLGDGIVRILTSPRGLPTWISNSVQDSEWALVARVWRDFYVECSQHSPKGFIGTPRSWMNLVRIGLRRFRRIVVTLRRRTVSKGKV